jgi:hypothetical protein
MHIRYIYYSNDALGYIYACARDSPSKFPLSSNIGTIQLLVLIILVLSLTLTPTTVVS